jgi:AraC-like DNA-binding protein
MSKRMSKAERLEQLQSIMYEHHEKALSQADLCAELIATEAGVSPVYFYRLVGEEYKKLRYELPGPRYSSKSINRMSRQNKKLQERLKELKAKYEKNIQESIA